MDYDNLTEVYLCGFNWWRPYLKVFFALCFAVMVAFAVNPTVENVRRHVTQFWADEFGPVPLCQLPDFECFGDKPKPQRQIEDEDTGNVFVVLVSIPLVLWVLGSTFSKMAKIV